MLGDHFRALGAQSPAPMKINRRAFVSAGIATPMVLLLDTKEQWAAPAKSEDLRFVEDAGGVSIIDPSDAVWRLHRLAFGPTTVFALRTLRAGSKKGYELEIGGIRFGTRKGRSHWIVFQRLGKDWSVRMRSNLWSPDGQEIDSFDVLLSVLATKAEPVTHPTSPSKENGATNAPSCAAPPPWFVFRRAAHDVSEALTSVLQGHVHFSGSLRLEFDADAVWRVSPQGSGRVTVAPFGFALSDLALAWCDIVTESAKACTLALSANLHPLGAGGAQADAEGSEPLFYAGGTIKPGAVRVNCLGESSFAAALQHEKDSSSLSYTYLRRDWSRTELGSSEIRGPWHLTLRLGQRTTLGIVDQDTGQKSGLEIADATLRAWRTPQAGSKTVMVQFSGVASAKPTILTTPVGRLVTSDRRANETSTDKNSLRIQIDAQYPGLEAGLGQPATATSVYIPILLNKSELALQGSDFSELIFKSTAVVGLWKQQAAISAALKPDQSYLWLGPAEALHGKPVARLDLTRTRLSACRNRDLLQVAFMFADLYLEVGSNTLKIVPASSTCLVTEREAPPPYPTVSQEKQVIDARPTLVVEFPPQHVLEEALFKAANADLPEITLPQEPKEFPVRLAEFTSDAREMYGKDPVTFSTSPASLLLALGELNNPLDRRKVRSHYADLKIAQEKGNDYKPFSELSKALADHLKDFKSEPTIADQFVYIGPYGMDADVSAFAREQMSKIQRPLIKKLFNQTLKTAADIAVRLINSDKPIDGDQTLLGRLFQQAKKFWLEHLVGSSIEVDGPEPALQREAAISAVLPDYAFFRDFYRLQMIKRLMTGVPGDDVLRPRDSSPEQIEYFAETNRAWASSGARAAKKLADQIKSRDEYFVELYLKQLEEGDDIPRSVRARLANPSRLAFRLNCGADESLPFTLNALTDWARHELAVTPRAQAVVTFDQSGRPLSAANGTPEATDQKGAQSKHDSDDIAKLALLGIRAGKFVTAQERLSDVETSLRKPPGPLETAIEIPARLTLSPSQLAVWRIPRPYTNPPSVRGIRPIKGRPAPPQIEGPVPLWGAELVTDNPQPLVRAVHSPDLRPGFIRRGLERAASSWANENRDREKKPPLFTTAASSPPRGPRAPWTLGIEEGDPSSSSLEDVMKALGIESEPGPVQDAILRACQAAEVTGSGSTQSHPLIEYLRWRKIAREGYKENGLFRSSLDAYDRHEIVLLSSAFGLPVRGKRELSGQLLSTQSSSQVELPNNLRPIDLEAGTALYRPRPLNLQELRLTALGGTLRHDTDFVPPTAARHISQGALYDSFSIERWQHWVVLGRDVFAEVVYKGFLFPIGHRASLVKQTERVFLRATTEDKKAQGSIRAYLRQRMFIRVGQPDKLFPALGQPNMGRQFPAGLVHILTTITPDLVDPTGDTKDVPNKKGEPSPAPGGRLFATRPGLVFWPRTARVSGAEVRFEALLDNAFVRLPLIFVDNTAAHDPDVISDLVKYYKTIPSPDTSTTDFTDVRASEHLRTVDFAGQSLRYSEELKPGSATHRTLFWTLTASGGVNSPPATGVSSGEGGAATSDIAWQGDNTAYDDPLLEGADQPPFYPALETARIRLDQIERMTAREVVVGLARFDGYYVANGFAAPPDQAQDGKSAPTRNANSVNHLEIYLNLLNFVPFRMGAAGDRSGGLFRPESTVVALSRLRGPIGGSQRPSAGPALTTVVGDYTDATAEATVPSVLSEGARRKAYDSFFTNSSPPGTSPLDTKLLGIVKLGDLLKYVGKLKPPNEGLPQLRELVSYGAADTLASGQAIRSSIIDPLNKAVGVLQSRWQALDAEVKSQSSSLIQLSIADVFPEVDQGIREFRAALGAASAAEGMDIYTSLAEVYESGRRLGDALGRASAHPIERVFMAIVGKLKGLLGKLEASPDDIAKAVGDAVVSMAGDKVEHFADELARVVLTDKRSLARFLPLPDSVDINRLNAQIDAVQRALSEELRQCTPDLLAEECANRFAIRLAPILLGDGSIALIRKYDPLIKALTPLFRLTQNIVSTKGNNPRAQAAVGLEALTLLGPAPAGQVLDDSALRRLFEQMLGAFEEIEKTVAALDLPNTMVSKFVESPNDVNVPKDWQRPANSARFKFFEAASVLEGALYDFATAAQAASKLQAVQDEGQIEVRQALFKASNLAFKTTQGLRIAAEAVAAARKQLSAQLAAGGILRVSQAHLEQVFGSLGNLMRAMGDAINAVLPESLPPLDAIGSKTNEQLAKTVGETVDRAVQVQKKTLALALLWITEWENLENVIGGKSAQGLKKAVSTGVDKLEVAGKISRSQVSSWSGWIAQHSTLCPLVFVSTDPADTPALTALAEEGSARLTDWRAAALSLGSLAAGKSSRVASQLTLALAEKYQSILKARKEVYDTLTDKLSALRRGLVVVPEATRIYKDAGFDSPAKILSPENDQLYWDHQSLLKLTSKISDTFLDEPKRMQYVTDYLKWWIDGSATPLRIIKQARDLNLAETRAALLSTVDFSSMREEIDQYVKRLIPQSAELRYAFQVELGPDAKEATAGIFVPQEGCQLTINSKATVNFIKPSAEFQSVGEIGPFNIHLLGDIDALTLKFAGARFESKGGPVQCDVRYLDFKIGSYLKFLDQLQSFLTPKQGSGFYLVPLSSGVGIEAGYGLNLGTISIGTISFFNVSLNAAARIPFDNRQATFVVSLSRRDAPFTISAAPYGGSGFFALEATASGIVGFEASFEYGGAAGFHYGPLEGHGRLMIGVYIRRGKENAIAATFYAGGTASIWIFSFGASLYVTAESSEGQTGIIGNATFTFSFSIGLADFDYRVNVRRKLEWQPNSSERASNSGDGANPINGPSTRKALARLTNHTRPEFRADSWCQGEHWGRHRECLDLGLDIDVEEFV
jgi:hypothetical protein